MSGTHRQIRATPPLDRQSTPSQSSTGRSRRRFAFIGQPEYFRFTYESDTGQLGEVAEFRLGMEMSASDYDDLIAYDADFNFFYRGEYVPNEVLLRLRGIRVALSSEPFPRLVDGSWRYTRDSLVRYLRFRGIRDKDFDFLFHYDAASLALLERDGLSPAGEFAFPVATNVFAPRELPLKWSLCFIGRSTPRREGFFWDLKHAHEFLHLCHGIYGSDIVPYVCSSAISLNVHAEAEVSWEPRLQMLMSCGAFVISESVSPNSYLRPGIDYVVADSAIEMRDAVDHYLRHEAERRVIADRGRARVLEVLDSRRVFGQLVDSLNARTLRPFTPGPPWTRVDTVSRVRDSWTWFKRLRA